VTKDALIRTDGVSEKVLGADSETENEFFRADNGTLVRLVEQGAHSCGEAIKNGHRVAEYTESQYEYIQMSQHLFAGQAHFPYRTI